MQKCGKERENGKDVHLLDAEQLGEVHVVPVTEFVRENALDFIRLALFDERIKDDNVFALSRTRCIVSEQAGMGMENRTHGRPKK